MVFGRKLGCFGVFQVSVDDFGDVLLGWGKREAKAEFVYLAVGQKENPWGPQVLVYFSFYKQGFLDTLF